MKKIKQLKKNTIENIIKKPRNKPFSLSVFLKKVADNPKRNINIFIGKKFLMPPNKEDKFCKVSSEVHPHRTPLSVHKKLKAIIKPGKIKVIIIAKEAPNIDIFFLSCL